MVRAPHSRARAVLTLELWRTAEDGILLATALRSVHVLQLRDICSNRGSLTTRVARLTGVHADRGCLLWALLRVVEELDRTGRIAITGLRTTRDAHSEHGQSGPNAIWKNMGHSCPAWAAHHERPADAPRAWWSPGS